MHPTVVFKTKLSGILSRLKPEQTAEFCSLKQIEQREEARFMQVHVRARLFACSRGCVFASEMRAAVHAYAHTTEVCDMRVQ